MGPRFSLAAALRSRRDESAPTAHLLTAGVAAGAVGFAAFVIVHSLVIAPIWDRSLHGFPFAILAGAALAWAFDAQPHDAAEQPLVSGVRFGAIVFATLLPATLIANAMRLAGLHPNDWPGLTVLTAIATASGAAAGRRSSGRAREMAAA